MTTGPLSHHSVPEPPARPQPPPVRPLPVYPPIQPPPPHPARPSVPQPPLSAPVLRGPVVGQVLLRADSDPVLERLLDERIIYVGGELDDAAAHRAITRLLLLSALDPRRDITLALNSMGGSVTAATAVHDTMRSVPPDVATRAIGLVGDGAQLLLTAGAKGKRQVLPHARILLRRPSAGLTGAASDAALKAGVGEELRRETAELIAGYSGRPVDAIEADSATGRWFSAADAVAYGLVDEVLTTR